MKMRVGLLCAATVCLIGIHACANINEADQRKKQAQTQGKYYVELTDDVERVEGTCKFMRQINAIEDPVRIPSKAETPDYFREKAAYYGADTVLLRGQVGDLYTCGHVGLNPDGTREAPYPTPIPH